MQVVKHETLPVCNVCMNVNGNLKVCTTIQVRKGRIQIKNVPKCGKSPKWGVGVGTKNQKVHNSKFGLFDKLTVIKVSSHLLQWGQNISSTGH